MKKLFLGLFLLINSNVYAGEYRLGDQVYVFEEKESGPFWGMKASYYYAKATVESINGNRIRISIIERCSNNQIKGGVTCTSNDSYSNYKSGRYYWVNEYELTKYPSNWRN